MLGGLNAHNGTREVFALGMTETALSSFGSWFVSPSVGVEIPLLSSDAGELGIVASASYVGGFVSGYTETGSSMNLIVGEQSIGNLDGRAGLSGKLSAGFSGVFLTADAGLFAVTNFGNSSVPVTVLGQTTDALTPGASGYGAYAGIGLDAEITSSALVSLRLDGSQRSDGLLSGAAKAKLEGSF